MGDHQTFRRRSCFLTQPIPTSNGKAKSKKNPFTYTLGDDTSDFNMNRFSETAIGDSDTNVRGNVQHVKTEKEATHRNFSGKKSKTFLVDPKAVKCNGHFSNLKKNLVGFKKFREQSNKENDVQQLLQTLQAKIEEVSGMIELKKQKIEETEEIKVSEKTVVEEKLPEADKALVMNAVGVSVAIIAFMLLIVLLIEGDELFNSVFSSHFIKSCSKSSVSKSWFNWILSRFTFGQ